MHNCGTSFEPQIDTRIEKAKGVKTFYYRYGPLTGLNKRGGGKIKATDVRIRCENAMREIEKHCNVKFVKSGKGLQILVHYRVNWYYRGWYSSKNKQIGLNSWIGSKTESMKYSEPQIEKLLLHELLHWLLGKSHSSDPKSIRHLNAGGTITKPDTALLQKHYGKLDDGTPTKPDTPTKPEVKMATKNDLKKIMSNMRKWDKQVKDFEKDAKALLKEAGDMRKAYDTMYNHIKALEKKL